MAVSQHSSSRRPWIIITNVTLEKPITFEQRMICCSMRIEMKNVGDAAAGNVMCMLDWDVQYLVGGKGLLKMPKLDMETETERMRRLSARIKHPTSLMPGCAAQSVKGMGTLVDGPRTERVFLFFGIRAGYWFADELTTTDIFFMINQKDTGIGIRAGDDGSEIQIDELSLKLYAQFPFQTDLRGRLIAP